VDSLASEVRFISVPLRFRQLTLMHQTSAHPTALQGRTTKIILNQIISRCIKMDLLEIELNVVDWIGLVQDRYRWRAHVNSVMNLLVP
jgi:hypothetical protein